MSTILFICLHGSAKSLIAAEHWNRLAKATGNHTRAESLGIEPDSAVPGPVVAGLARDGFDVREYVPQPATPDQLRAASHIVSFGCELTATPAGVSVEQWSDLPMVSDGYDVARDAIVARVEALFQRRS
jgi:protein-tyrosine-phosphatase